MEHTLGLPEVCAEISYCPGFQTSGFKPIALVIHAVSPSEMRNYLLHRAEGTERQSDEKAAAAAHQARIGLDSDRHRRETPDAYGSPAVTRSFGGHQAAGPAEAGVGAVVLVGLSCESGP